MSERLETCHSWSAKLCGTYWTITVTSSPVSRVCILCCNSRKWTVVSVFSNVNLTYICLHSNSYFIILLLLLFSESKFQWNEYNLSKNSSFWHFTVAVFTKSAMENKRKFLCNFWHGKTTTGSELLGISTSFYGIYTSSAYFTESQNCQGVMHVNWT